MSQWFLEIKVDTSQKNRFHTNNTDLSSFSSHWLTFAKIKGNARVIIIITSIFVCVIASVRYAFVILEFIHANIRYKSKERHSSTLASEQDIISQDAIIAVDFLSSIITILLRNENKTDNYRATGLNWILKERNRIKSNILKQIFEYSCIYV